MILPSDMHRSKIHKRYVDSVTDLSNALNKGSGVIAIDPLTFFAFTRYLEKEHATLKVANKGSDFCYLCLALKKNTSALHSNDEWHSFLTTLLQDSVNNARKEHTSYMTKLNECHKITDGGLQHL